MRLEGEMRRRSLSQHIKICCRTTLLALVLARVAVAGNEAVVEADLARGTPTDAQSRDGALDVIASISSASRLLSAESALASTLSHFPSLVNVDDVNCISPADILSRWPVRVRIQWNSSKDLIEAAPDYEVLLRSLEGGEEAIRLTTAGIDDILRTLAVHEGQEQGPTDVEGMEAAALAYCSSIRSLTRLEHVDRRASAFAKLSVRRAFTKLTLPYVHSFALAKYRSQVGTISTAGSIVGTCFPVAPDRLITARHVLAQLGKAAKGDFLEVEINGARRQVVVADTASIGRRSLDVSLLVAVDGGPPFQVPVLAASSCAFERSEDWLDRRIMVIGAFSGLSPFVCTGELKLPHALFASDFDLLRPILPNACLDRFKGLFWPQALGGQAPPNQAFYREDEALPLRYMLWRDYQLGPQPVVMHTLDHLGQGASGGLVAEIRTNADGETEFIGVVGIYLGLLSGEDDLLGPHVSLPVSVVPREWR